VNSSTVPSSREIPITAEKGEGNPYSNGDKAEIPFRNSIREGATEGMVVEIVNSFIKIIT